MSIIAIPHSLPLVPTYIKGTLKYCFIIFQIEIIVSKAQIKNINVRMLSACVDDCSNYKFAICFPG